MLKLLLVSAVLIAVVQGQDTPPHVLFLPSTFSVGSEETVTITIYDDSVAQFIVEVELLYTECQCNTNSRRQCEEDIMFSKDTAVASNGQPVKLKVQMPDSAQLPDRQSFYLKVSADNGSITFIERQFVSLTNRGYLFVRTDKPIYKPSQTVEFCVVSVDANLLPTTATVDVRVTDARPVRWGAQSRNIMTWDDVKIGRSGIKCLEFPLSDEPRFGEWRIIVNEKINTGSCRYYQRIRSETCKFEVKEFVLPRFSVELSGPNRIERSDTAIRGMVSSEYTFGEPVNGTVTLNFTLEASGRRESLMFSQVVAQLNKKGKYSFTVKTEEYQRIVRYRFDPFCVKSTIKITAEVAEAGRGTTQSTEMVIPLVANPVTLSFAEGTPKSFRPGLPYMARVKASYPDGSVAGSIAVQITATINNNDNVLLNDDLTTDESGIAVVPISVPANANCLQVKAKVSEEFPSCEETRLCISPAPLYSPTGSFVQVTDKTSKDIYEVGEVANFTAQSTFPFEILHIMTVSQANIVNYTTAVADKAVRKHEFTITINYGLVPGFKLLVFFAREDGELVADMIEVKVKCEFKHKVDVSFSKDSAQPGDDISITTMADADTPVLVGVIDTSLTLLADACKSLESNNVCEKLKSLTRGSLTSIDSTCPAESTGQCCPTACQEPTKISSRNFFQLAGVTMRSNMFQPTAPVRPTNPPPITIFERVRPGQPGPAPTISEDLSVVTTTPPPTDDAPSPDSPRTRTFFPETWIFRVNQTDSTGMMTIESVVPDTITSWVAEAFAFSATNGLGIAAQTSLTVAKPFFVSLELPFSINYEEEVTITPLVFNFLSNRLTVRLRINIDDNLLLLNKKDIPKRLRVPAGSSKPFTMQLKALGVGNFPIRITATTTSSDAQDSVERLLFVKPGCVKQVNTTNVVITGTREESIVVFDFSQLPACHIPGSQRASISVTGDIASPPNLTNLLILPSGCGEQNLVKLALNTVVAKYLQETEGLPEHTAIRVCFNLQTGYQRQLNYQAIGGYFSVWSGGEPSLWLTSAAIQAFSDIPRALEDCGNIVDQAVVNAAVSYLIRKQRKNGAFPRIGRVHNYQLLGFEGGEFALTGFTLKALKSYKNSFKGLTIDRQISNATSYLIEVWRNYTKNKEELCSYGIALAACALAEQPTEKIASPSIMIEELKPIVQPESSVRSEMIEELKTRIQRESDGTCFICNDCGDDKDDSNDECSGPSQSTTSSTCTETTAYTLLALLNNKKEDLIFCLASWLAKQKNRFGVFGSSQDSVVAIRALTQVAELSFSEELSLTINVDLPDGVEDQHQITNENRYTKTTYEMSLPGVAEVKWSGSGRAILQAVLEYHGCDCCQASRAFDLSVTPRFVCNAGAEILILEMCFLYNGVNSSNMALLDFEMPSGYTYQSWSFVSPKKPSVTVERTEQTGNGATLYIDEVGKTRSCIEAVAVMTFTVNNPMSPPVTIYDYYNTGQAVTRYYDVVTPSTICNRIQ